MAYTGSPLNELNGKMGISAPFKSVSVMKLIRIHKPKSKEELVQLKSYRANFPLKVLVASPILILAIPPGLKTRSVSLQSLSSS